MKQANPTIILWILLCVTAFLPPDARCAQHATMLDNQTFMRLERVKNRKKQQLTALLRAVERQARDAANDATLQQFFRIMNRDQDLLAPDAPLPDELRHAMREYQRTIDTYYLNTYLNFYDILFIDATGFVFYSIRKESDYRTSILTGPLQHTGLARCLQTPEYEFFIDFQYYSPADEPAAFFLVRIYEKGELKGWIVFQYALTMLNALLVDHDELGETGEVYIVNRDHYMLTRSRFSGDARSLHIRVDTDAVRHALQGNAGHDLITGYRGTRVYVAYEHFTLWNTGWIIIASIEESEVLTEYYRAHTADCLETVLQQCRRPGQLHPDPPEMTGRPVKVDMDEFGKAGAQEVVVTRGVSTCTAVAAILPGRFACLAHMSPHDKIYGSANPLHTLKDMMRQITHYDLYLHELPQLRIVVIAPHTDSIATILDKLLKYGCMLSQIRFACNPQARYANISCDGRSGDTVIEWVGDRAGFQSAAQLPPLDRILYRVIRTQAR